MPLGFLSPAKIGQAEITERKSRFIGTAAPVFSAEEAEAFIVSIREKHPDATHNVYAYTVGTRTPQDRVSDDGEPRGTAGYPVLEVIRKRNLRNAICVVTRYFGGTLLGAGGLLRAYGKTASRALDLAGASHYRYHNLARISLDYAEFNRVQRELEAWNCFIDKVEYAAQVEIRAYLPEKDMDALLARVKDLTGGKSKIKVEEGKYIPV